MARLPVRRGKASGGLRYDLVGWSMVLRGGVGSGGSRSGLAVFGLACGGARYGDVRLG